MKVIITGAKGFIGSHLVRRWQSQHELILTSTHGAEVRGSLEYHDLDTVLEGTRLQGVEAIVHLAQGKGGDPIDQFRVNCQITSDLLAAAEGCGVSKFIFTSSGGVYGPRLEYKCSEATDLQPRDFYHQSKAVAEGLVGAYQGKVKTFVFRLYAPYGPGQTGRMIPGIIKRVREGTPVELIDGGSPVMNPTYIDDILDCFDRALTTEDGFLGNVGGTEDLSIEDMATTIGRLLGKEPKFIDKGGSPQRKFIAGFTQKMDEWLGHSAQVSFEEGIRRTIS